MAYATASHQLQPPREGGQHSRRTAAPHHTVSGGHRPGQAPANDRPADTTSHDTPPANNNRMTGRCPVVRNRPLHSVMQQRCHHASVLARSLSSPPMPRPSLQQAATVLQEKFQLPVVEQNPSSMLDLGTTDSVPSTCILIAVPLNSTAAHFSPHTSPTDMQVGLEMMLFIGT